MIFKPRLSLTAALLGALLSCTGATESEEAGVSFRLDASPDAVLGSFEELGRAALDELSPPVISLRSAQILANRDLLVVDWRQHRIVRLSSTGEVRRVFGREGAGPGEFRSLSHVLLVGTDSLLVYDNDLARFTVFDLAGNFLGSSEPTWVETGMRLSHLLPAPDGVLIGVKSMLPPRALLAGAERDSILFLLADRTGVFTGSGGLLVPDRLLSATIENNAIHVSIHPDGPRALVAATNGGLLVAENTTRWAQVIPFGSIASSRTVSGGSTPAAAEERPTLGTMASDGGDGAWVTEREGSNGQRTWFRVVHDGFTTDVVRMPEQFSLVAARGDTLLVRTQDIDGGLELVLGVVR